MLNIDKSMERFKRDLHIWSVFAGSENLMLLANPKIYIRSKWKPRDWDISIALKRCLQKFCKALELKFQFLPILHNLLPHQRQTIIFIKSNPNLMVVQTNKGLVQEKLSPRNISDFLSKIISEIPRPTNV